MKENILLDLSKKYAVDIINLTSKLQDNKKIVSIAVQLMRSGTSIGANIHEANYASSKADFCNKLKIALKENNETEYWLEILKDTGNISKETFEEMFSKNSKIKRLLINSIKTSAEVQ